MEAERLPFFTHRLTDRLVAAARGAGEQGTW